MSGRPGPHMSDYVSVFIQSPSSFSASSRTSDMSKEMVDIPALSAKPPQAFPSITQRGALPSLLRRSALIW